MQQFSLTDYASIDKSVWGPHYWFVLHSFAENYPEHPNNLDKEVALNFLKSFPFLLPCAECSHHAYQYVKDRVELLPKIVLSRKNMIHFMITFHNDVNIRIGKPIFLYK